jgi:ElaB/YqjD/DUF883 family membrane-anchored ribosome-binding protein
MHNNILNDIDNLIYEMEYLEESPGLLFFGGWWIGASIERTVRSFFKMYDNKVESISEIKKILDTKDETFIKSFFKDVFNITEKEATHLFNNIGKSADNISPQLKDKLGYLGSTKRLEKIKEYSENLPKPVKSFIEKIQDFIEDNPTYLLVGILTIATAIAIGIVIGKKTK